MEPKDYNEIPVGDDMKMWLPPGAEKDRNLDGAERKARSEVDKALTERAQQRQDYCWMKTATGCQHTPTRWVRDVQFDFKEDKAGINFAQVTANGIEGPVPGFCDGCIGEAPRLAEAVYRGHVAVRMGMRPRRWFVVMTDGLKSGGLITEFDPNPQDPVVVEEYISNGTPKEEGTGQEAGS